MYHDQALIPIKTLHFDEAVNITLGLPIVRTSPDHGTAFDIAGQDRADAAPDGRGDPHGGGMRGAARGDGLSQPAEPLREVIARHGLSASKALGQNFLLDRQLLARIAAIPGDLHGAARLRSRPWTRRPDPRAARRRRVGRRGRARPPLHSGARRAGARVRREAPDDRRRRAGDRRAQSSLGLARMSSPTCPTMSAPPCCCWLGGDWPPWWRSLTLMFQKEVAERIVAQPAATPTAGCRSLAVALAAPHRDDGQPLRVRAAAEGDVGGRPHRPERGSRRACIAKVLGTADRGRLRPAAQDAAVQPQSVRRRDRSAEALGIDLQRRAETLSVDEFVEARAGAELVLLRSLPAPSPKRRSGRG